MPRIPTDYSKALIYKIVCNDIKIKECYYGSTTNFKARKYGHKTSCNNINSKLYNSTFYQFIRENGGWDNWNMVLVKYYPCNNKLELEREERMCMENDENRLNNNLPAITDDEKKEHMKKYYKENAVTIREQHKTYYKETKTFRKEKHKKYRDNHKEEAKKYREDNKEQNKKYREENKEKLHTNYDCKCGGHYQYKHKSEHFKSKKHQKYIKNN